MSRKRRNTESWSKRVFTGEPPDLPDRVDLGHQHPGSFIFGLLSGLPAMVVDLIWGSWHQRRRPVVSEEEPHDSEKRAD